MNEPTKESLLNQANAIADQRGQNFVLRKDFKQETGIGAHYIFKYWNSWSEFFSEAGLTPQNREPLSNEELFKAAFNVLITEESIPTFIRFGKLIQYSQAERAKGSRGQRGQVC